MRYLQKNKNLNVNQVKAIFSTPINTQDGNNPTRANGVAFTEAFGGGIINGKKSVDAVP